MKNKKGKIWVYVLVIVLVIALLNTGIWLLETKTPQTSSSNDKNELTSGYISGDAYVTQLALPAVDDNGKGVSTYLKVEATKGEGRTLTDIENLLFWADTQQSIRMARYVAGNVSEKNLDEYNLVYSINANASLIGGPSAGAALTIATIYALEGKAPRKDVMITGTINHDGSVGPVGGILEKAEASKSAGATVFLVPLLQSQDVVYETKEHCQNFGSTQVCTTETKPKKVDIEQEAGIKVIEIANIKEALKYYNSEEIISS